MFYDIIRSFDDRLCGTIVLLEIDDEGFGIIFLKGENVIDISSSP
jgi:hypothetical protein